MNEKEYEAAKLRIDELAVIRDRTEDETKEAINLIFATDKYEEDHKKDKDKKD